MKTILVFSITAILLVSMIGNTNAVFAQYGMSGHPYYRIHLDKIEYSPGDTVVIKVEGGMAGFTVPSNNEVSLTISELTNDVNDTSVIYQEKKQLVKGWAEFNYEIRSSADSSYRYLVQIYEPDDSTAYDKAIFFSRQDASKIVISDLNFGNVVDSNGNLNFSYKVTDIFGNPISGLVTDPRMFYQSCDSARNGLPSDISETKEYLPTGIINGTLTILPDFEPGIYSMYIDALGPTSIGYQYTRHVATVQYLGETSGMEIIDSKDITQNFDPPKSQVITSILNLSDHIIDIESDNRICDYKYSESDKKLVIHVSSTELPQFMNMTIPKDMFDGDIALSINGYSPNFDIIDKGNNYVLSFKYLGCPLTLDYICQINVFEKNANSNGSGSNDQNLKSNAVSNCTYSIASQMDAKESQLNNTKAMSLAANNQDFQSKITGYNATFNSIFSQWSWDQECNLTWLDVNVAYSLYDDKGYVKNVIVTLDPELTHVVSVSEQEGGFYSGAAEEVSLTDSNQTTHPLKKQTDLAQEEVECIGGSGMCPEERKLIEEKEDYQNFILISAIGIPTLAIAIGFVVWNNRKKSNNK